MNQLRVAVAGIHGKMGRTMLEVIANDDRFAASAGIVSKNGAACNRSHGARDGSQTVLASDVHDLRGMADVVVDFTTPEATVEIASRCGDIGLPLVSGTTGLDPAQFDDLRRSARHIPIVWAANMSVGITAIRNILADLARVLDDYDVEIVERHHRRKVDAPSGTALELGELVAASTGGDFDARVVFGRYGRKPRPGSEVGVHAVRAGGDPGSHTVIFGGDSDEVTVSHRAFGRECYARGALDAAAFVIGQCPGLYNMADVVASRTALTDPTSGGGE